MAYLLIDAVIELAQVLHRTRVGVSTSAGTQTTLKDSTVSEPNDWYNNGTLIVKAQMVTMNHIYADSLIVITDYNSSTNTFTVPTQDVEFTTGVSYAACGPKFPLYVLKQSINQALQEIGPITHETTFTSTGAETYRAATNAAIDKKIMQIWEAKESAAPYNWTPHTRWTALPYGTASAQELVFYENSRPESGSTIKLIYLDRHTEVSDPDDAISGWIAPGLLLWTAAVYALSWRLGETKLDEPETQNRMERSQAMKAMMMARHKVPVAVRAGVSRW